MKNNSVKTVVGTTLITLSVGLNVLLLTNKNEELPQVTSTVDSKDSWIDETRLEYTDQILENNNVIVSYTDLNNGDYSLVITDKTPGSFLELPKDTEWNTTIKVSNIQMYEDN